MRKLVVVILVGFALLFPKNVFAVTSTINNPPGTVSSSEFTLNVTVTGANDGKNYIRIDLYKDGSTNYFGETFNGSSWVRDADGNQYLPVDIVSGNWTGDVKGRIGSPSTGEYDGQGTYKLRVKRYTSSGAQGGEDANASSVTVTINAPTATPTPTSNPTNTPTPTPTNSPSNTPTPSPTPSKSPTATPKAGTPTVVPSKPKASGTPSQEVMTAMNTSMEKPQVQGAQTSNQSDVDLGGQLDALEAPKQPYNWWKLLIIMGTVIVTGACSLFMYNNYLKSRKEEEG